MRAGASITDIGAATYGVMGILAALYRREQTGIGDSIESGLYETIVFWISQYVTTAQMTGTNPAPRGTHNSGMGKAMGWGVYQLFETRDGKQVFIAVTGNRHWTGLCDALGFDDWKHAPEFSNNRKRSSEKRRIAERVKEAVRKYSFDEITERLYQALVPYAPVGTPLDLVNEKHLNEAQRWLPLKIGDQEFKAPKLPLAMNETRDFEAREQPAYLGEHTDRILNDLGYSKSEIESLKTENVVRRTTKMLNIDSLE